MSPLHRNVVMCQLFVILWVWHCVLILVGVLRLLTRVVQLSSANIRSVSVEMERKGIAGQ